MSAILTKLISHPESEYHVMVFLVDDQAFVAEAVRRAIAKEPDVDLHYCANPLEAVATAVRIKPTVILLDLVMPQANGLALVPAFRANPVTSEIPIVMLSTQEDPQVKSDTFAAGANDYLVKLPDRLELLARLRYHSRAYLNKVQRDEAFQALRESQQKLMEKNTALAQSNEELTRALSEVKKLRGLLPICCRCKKVRDDHNYWHQIESYIGSHSDLKFSHGLCPECLEKEMAAINGPAPMP